MLTPTYNIENTVFDSDELTTRLGRGCVCKAGNFLIEWLQFDNPVEEPGDNVDDEDVVAVLVSDPTPNGIDIDGGQVPILVLCQPHTLGQVDLGFDVDLAQ